MAKSKTKSILGDIKALKAGKATPAPKAKIEKIEKNKVQPKADKRKGNGGKRDGSGRKTLQGDEKRTTIKRSWENFADEDIEVTELHAGTKEMRKVKAKRLRIVQERLFAAANKGDISAIKEFNDRVGGKARQPVVGDQEEDPVQIDLGVDRLLERAYGEDEEGED